MTDVAVTTGDLIPLLDDNGSAQYIKGRNNSRDFRVGVLGSLFMNGADGFTPRTGVIPVTGVDLQVQPQASPNQTVIVKKGRCIVPRTGQGAYLFFNEADQTVNMPAASGVNNRYDIVCAFAADKGNFGGDAVHGPQFHVESGATGGSPTVPATPAGMIKLAEVLRATNDNVISLGEIADKRMYTSVVGGIRPLGPGDALVDPGLITAEMRDTGTSVDRWSGAAWVPQYYVNGGEQRGVLAEARLTTDSATYNAITMLWTITATIPAGRRIRAEVRSGWSVVASTTEWQFHWKVGGSVTTADATFYARKLIVPVASGFDELHLVESITGFPAGTVTFGISATNLDGLAGGKLIGDAANIRTFRIYDDGV